MHSKSTRRRIALTATLTVPLCLALALVWVMTPRGKAQPAYEFVAAETKFSHCDRDDDGNQPTLVSLQRC